MSSARTIRHRSRVAVGLLMVLMIGALGAAGVRAAAEEGDRSGGQLSVNITDGLDPTPTPTPNPDPTPTPDPTPDPTPTPIPTPPPGAVVQDTITDPDQADDALGDDAASIGGILYMSGITAIVSPDFSPGNGSVTLSFTVRNTSSTTFDATSRFWLETIAGIRVARSGLVLLRDLEPGETRRITTTLGGLGQHPVLWAKVTLTPPDEVQGVPLSPLTREALVALPPLFSLTIVGAVVAIGLAFWLFLLKPGGLGLGWLFGLRRGE